MSMTPAKQKIIMTLSVYVHMPQTQTSFNDNHKPCQKFIQEFFFIIKLSSYHQKYQEDYKASEPEKW